MLSGSCLCGEVTYQVAEPIDHFTHCHCSMCRKIHGTPFGTYFRSPQVTFTSGRDNIAMYESSPGFFRCFCNQCGSVAPEESQEADYHFVPAGGIDGDITERPSQHIFVESKADWYQITDELPQADCYSMDSAGAGVEQADRSNAQTGHVAGSCLCGKVTFKYTEGAEKLMMLCHCSRCRKVKGAAHAYNLFVAPQDFHWLTGADNVTVYDLPNADRFGNSFCRDCGSSVPRKSANSPMFNIPVGTLDDTPDIDPKAHIFVGSKSNWFEITGSILQCEEMPQD